MTPPAVRSVTGNGPDDSTMVASRRADRPGSVPRWLREPVVLAAATVVLLSALFLAAPDIDLAVTRVFYLPGHGFPFAGDRVLVAFRNSLDVLIALVVVLLLASIAVKLARPERPSPLPPERTLFLLAALILGPGLLVNVVLKNHWGRPRPMAIGAFGGASPYVPVWEVSRFCSRNCSFVAGEASGAAWLVGAALLLPRPWRWPAAAAAAAYALLIGANRIAFGGHFLSDVLLSFALTSLVMALLHRLFVGDPPPPLAGPRLEAELAAIGARLRARRADRAATR